MNERAQQDYSDIITKRPDYLPGKAQLRGNPRFPIPLIPGKGIPNGDRVHHVIERLLRRYGHCLPAAYRNDLWQLSDAVQDLSVPYAPRVPDQPLSGIQEPIRRIFQCLVDSPQGQLLHLDPLRIWLLRAVHQYRNAHHLGIDSFLKHLANAISAELPPTLRKNGNEAKDARRLLLQLDKALTAEGKVPHSLAKQIARLVGFPRGPTPKLAIHTLTSLRGTPPPKVEMQSATMTEEGPQELEPRPDLTSHEIAHKGNDDPKPAQTVPFQAATEKPDPRLRLTGILLGDTEASLAHDEARALYIQLVDKMYRAPVIEAEVIDLVLALMLVTSRDRASVFEALEQRRSGTPQSSGTTLNLLPTYWESLPNIPYADESDAPCARTEHRHGIIRLPYPEKLFQILRLFDRCQLAMAHISRTQFDERVRHHKKTIAPRLTLTRLRRTLPVLLYATVGHPRTAQLIVGCDGYRSDAPLAYYSPQNKTIAAHYISALQAARIAMLPLGRITEVNDSIRVGSRKAALRRDTLRAAFDRLTHSTVKPRPRWWNLPKGVEEYNQVVLNTALMYVAATAHRCSFALAQTRLSDIVLFPEGFGVTYLSDKRHEGLDRIATLPRTFFQQLDSLRHAMEHMRLALLESGYKDAMKRLVAALSGTGPLFIQIKKEDLTVRTLRPSELNSYCQLPISIRRMRHWFATRAEELGIPAADIAQQMGHMIDRPPYSETDPDSPWCFAQRMDAHLTRYLEDLGIGPIQVAPPPQTRTTPRPHQWDVGTLLRQVDNTHPASQHDADSYEPLDGTNSEDAPKSEDHHQPHSNILRTHLHAYNLARHLEDALWEQVIAPDLDVEQTDSIDNSVMQVALAILLSIWGLSTVASDVQVVARESRLVRIPNMDGVVGLLRPDSHHRHGVQLLSPHQTLALARLKRASETAPDLASLNELVPLLTGYSPSIAGLLGRADYHAICRMVAMARQLTTPGQRAAWESGRIKAAGIRPDRIIALTTNQCVSPITPPAQEPDPTTHQKGESRGKPQALYKGLREALYRMQIHPSTNCHMEVREAADALFKECPEGSLPRLAARAILHELAPKKKALRASSIYTYLTNLSGVIESAIEVLESPNEQPLDTTFFLILDWLSADRDPAPLAWLIRANHSHESINEIDPELWSEIPDIVQAPDRPPRPGDPISAAEYEWLRSRMNTTTQIASLPGRELDPSLVMHHALHVQAAYALRSAELTRLRYQDYFPGRFRHLVWVHPVRFHPGKSKAAKRNVALDCHPREAAQFTWLLARTHGRQEPPHPGQTRLFPTKQTPINWQRQWHMTFATAAREMCSIEGTPTIRPHGFRHGYAIAQALRLLPTHHPHVSLHLPYSEPRYPINTRWSLRTQYDYIARQLGHGHPRTTLDHYDHSISLMTRTTQGWRVDRIPLKHFSAWMDTNPSAFDRAWHRRVGKQRPGESLLPSLLALPCISDTYSVRPFPTPQAQPLADTTVEAIPDHTNHMLRIAQTAIILREGSRLEDLAARYDLSYSTLALDTERLYQAEYDIGTSFLKPKNALKHKSRLTDLLRLFEHLNQVPRSTLHEVAFAFAIGRADATQKLRSAIANDKDPTAEKIEIGSSGKDLIKLVLYVYVCHH